MRKIIISVIIVVVVVALVTGGAFACTSSKTTWTNNDDDTIYDDTIYTDVVQDIYAGYDWEYDEQIDSGDDSYSSDYGNGNYPYTGQIALNEAQENMKGCLDWASLYDHWEETDDVLAVSMLGCANFTNPSDKFTLLEDRNIGADSVYSETFMCQLISAYVPDYDGDLEASLAMYNDKYYKEYSAHFYNEEDVDYDPITLENGVVDYGVRIGELGQGSCYDFYITSWVDNADGTSTVEAQRTYYWRYEEFPAPTLTYRFELVPNSYTEQMSDPIFEYSIESVEYLGDYFLLDSDTHYWAESEIAGMAKLIAYDATNYKKALRFMRNEIYARHGAIFQDSELQSYFESQPWYTPTVAVADFGDSDLNACEHANIEAILDLEAAAG